MKKKLSQLMFEKYRNTSIVLPAYNATADFNWIRTQSSLPWLQLDIKIPVDIILNEILSIESLLVAHRDEYAEHQGWKSFCIHGKSYDATKEESYYNDNRPYIWTPEAIHHLPKTVEYFQQWPSSDFRRIRIMLLEPGGYIAIHQDSDQSCFSAINIAITQPTDCSFVMEHHGTVPFKPGTAFWMNLSNSHVVFNNGNQKRWHIIVHQSFSDPTFQKIVANSYKTMYNN
jgi:hypothetical protein